MFLRPRRRFIRQRAPRKRLGAFFPPLSAPELPRRPGEAARRFQDLFGLGLILSRCFLNIAVQTDITVIPRESLQPPRPGSAAPLSLLIVLNIFYIFFCGGGGRAGVTLALGLSHL